MKLKNLPIRITITSAFVGFMALAVFFVAYINYTENQKEIMRTAHQLVGNALEIARQNIDGLLGRAQIVSKSISDLPGSVIDWRNPEELQLYLMQTLRHDANLYGSFVGFPDGGFVQAVNFRNPDGSSRNVPGIPADAAYGLRVIEAITGKLERLQFWRFFDTDGKPLEPANAAISAQSKYDPRVRAWYKDALTKQQTTFSAVYVFSSLRKPGITISTSARNAAGAVIGVDLPLTNLANLMHQLRPGKRGSIAIIDKHSNLVAHHDLEKIVRRNANGSYAIAALKDIDESILISAVARLKSAGTGASMGHEADHAPPTERRRDGAHPNHDMKSHSLTGAIGYETDFGHIIAGQTPAGDTRVLDWKIIGVAVADDFTEHLRESLQRSAIFTIAIFVLAIAGVTLLASWIAIPIIRLRKLADRISEMNLSSTDAPESPFDEIGSLQGSMERMRGALDIFLRYVPRDLVRSLVLSGRGAEIGGEKRQVTVLFTDIEGFTTMTERMTSEQVLEQTSLYFERMSFAIQANRGTIDKFIGDAIMVMWNAPTDDEFHVDNACRAVLTAHEISEELNAELMAEGLPVMRTRFGLHSGEALVGNMGARDRLQYTCLGPNVNLAARIEGLNKFYGTQTLVSEQVRRQASRDFLFRRVDIVEAKGTSIPLVLYELMGERQEGAAFYVGEKKVHQASRYEQAFDFYLHRDFQHAVDLLEELQAAVPDDGVVSALLRRCRYYIETPPSPDWNGVTAFDSK